MKNPDNTPSLILKNCLILGAENGDCAMRLQNLAGERGKRIITRIESCVIVGGIYLTIYHESGEQRFEVTLINSGNPHVLCDKAEENIYPVKYYNA